MRNAPSDDGAGIHEIDLLCDRYEQAVRSGTPCSIRDLIEQIAPQHREALVRELVALDLELHEDDRPSERLAELAEQSPEHREVILSLDVSPRKPIETIDGADSSGSKAPPPGQLGLLVGALAWQNGVIDELQLFRSLKTWILDKHKPLSDVLTDLRTISDEQRTKLEQLAHVYLQFHDSDVVKAIQSVPLAPEVAALLNEHLGSSEPQKRSAQVAGRSNPDETVFDASEPQPDQIDAETSRFRIVASHAKGGLGEVFIAEDKELNREVALKEIKLQFSDETDSRLRFLREAEVTGGLEHPGIVPVYGLGQYPDGRPYYAMRLIRGDSLKSVIQEFHSSDETPKKAGHRESNLLLRRLLRSFLDVCNAISYAHSRGVIHRDIKPSNIMLGKHGETIVVDWGLARVVGRQDLAAQIDEGTLRPTSGSSVTPTIMGSAVGTPAYMPPEQAQGRLDDICPASDVYSLGATLFHLLTGEAPFRHDNLGMLLSDVKNGKFPKPRSLRGDIAPELEAICLHAMQRQPEDRYQSARLLADDIERYLADEAPSVFRDRGIQRVRRWVRKHPTLAATTTTAVLFTAVLMGASSLILGKKNRQLSVAQNNERELRLAAEETTNIAQSQSKLALSTLTYVIDDLQVGLRDIPGTSALRRDLLRTAMQQLEAIAANYTESSQVDLSTVQALNEMGQLVLAHGTSPELPQEDAEFNSADDVSAIASAERFYRQAISIAESLAVAENDNPDFLDPLADSWHGLAQVHVQAGNVAEAEKATRWSLQQRERSLAFTPADSQRLLKVANSVLFLGYLNHLDGQLMEAITHFERGLEICETAHGKLSDEQITEHLALEASTRSSLGQTLLLLGKTDQALEQAQRSMKIRESIVDEAMQSKRDLANSCDQVGHILLQLDRREEATECFEKQLAIAKELSENYANDLLVMRLTLHAQRRLGDVMTDSGNADVAEKHYVAGLELAQALVDADGSYSLHRRQLATLHISLARVLATLPARLDEAAEHFQASVAVRRELVEDVPENIRLKRELSAALDSLAALQVRQGDLAEARKNLEQSLDLSERTQAVASINIRDLSRVSRTWERIADLELAVQDLQAAHEAFERSIKIQRQILLQFEPLRGEIERLAWLLRRAAQTYVSDGQEERAIDILAERMQFLQTQGSMSQRPNMLLGSWKELGEVHAQAGNFSAAATDFQHAVEIAQQLCDRKPDLKNRRSLATLLETLAGAYQSGQQAELALETWDQSLAVRRELVEEFPGNLAALQLLKQGTQRAGDLAVNSGDGERAIALFREAEKHARIAYEMQSPGQENAGSSVVVAQRRLGRSLLEFGHVDEGFEVLTRSTQVTAQLTTDFPDSRSSLMLDAHAHEHLGEAYVDYAPEAAAPENLTKAIAAFEAAIESYHKILDTPTERIIATIQLAHAHQTLGTLHLRAEQPSVSDEHNQTSFRLIEALVKSAEDDLRPHAAMLWWYKKQNQETVAEQKPTLVPQVNRAVSLALAVDIASAEPTALVDAARILALSLLFKEVYPERMQGRIPNWQKRALQLIKVAVRKSPGLKESVSQNDDFEALHTLPEFAGILE